MKPVQFDLKINPEALVTRAEEHLHFLRELVFRECEGGGRIRPGSGAAV